MLWLAKLIIPMLPGFCYDYIMKHSGKYSGFTLIEIAIVLVIIGLIVGGVLVGRDLIRAAELRATIKQLEQFNTAVNAFRTKYNCLPGDCGNAGDFGFSIGCTATSGPNCNSGNGDDTINRAFGNFSGGGNDLAEYANVWYHLSAASLISDSFPNSAYALYNPGGGSFTAATQIGYATPQSKILPLTFPYPVSIGAIRPYRGGWSVAENIQFDAVTAGGGNFSPHSLILGLPFVFGLTTGFGPGPFQGTLTGYPPADIYAIDSKIDDGLPLSGTARAISRMQANNNFTFLLTNNLRSAPGRPASIPLNAYCVDDTATPPQYNAVYAGNPAALSNPAGWRAAGNCSLAVKASF